MPAPIIAALLGRIGLSAGMEAAAGRVATSAAGRSAASSAYGAHAQASITQIDQQLASYAHMSQKEKAFHSLFQGGPAELEGRKALIERSELAWQNTMGGGRHAGPDMAQQAGQGMMNQMTNQVGGMLQGAMGRIMNKAMEPIQNFIDKAVDRITTPPHEQMLKGATDAARRGRMIIQDDFLGIITEQLPPAAKRFVDELSMLTKAIVEKGRALSIYSGDLAQAAARADIRSMMADINEARGPGREYARVIDEQSKLETTFRNALNPAKEAIAGGIANLLQMLNDLVKTLHIPEGLIVLGEIMKVVSKFTTFDPKQIAQAFADLPRNIAKAIKEYLTGSGDETLEEAIRRAKDNLKNDPRVPLGNRGRFNDGRFNFPIVQGI